MDDGDEDGWCVEEGEALERWRRNANVCRACLSLEIYVLESQPAFAACSALVMVACLGLSGSFLLFFQFLHGDNVIFTAIVISFRRQE